MTELNSDKYTRRRKITDFLGGAGMILIAVGLLIPLFNMSSTELLPMCKWVYTIGTLMFLGAKSVRTVPTGSSFRMRRMRRLEFWSGVCFLIGAAFWFYNEHKLGGSEYAGPLAIVHDTILFSLSGAVVELVASWLIYFREKKEAKQNQEGNDKK